MSVTYRQFQQIEACRKSLLHALEDEMAKRKFRQYADWVEKERQAMLLAANQWIVAYTSAETLTLEEIEAVEDMAVGHVDYARKFVLYVSELIYR